MKNPEYLTQLLGRVNYLLAVWGSSTSDVQHAVDRLSIARRNVRDAPDMPKIVCLCGSTRFYDQFQRSNFEETMAGRIVLSVGFCPNYSGSDHGESAGITPEQKIDLDILHKQKIDLADEVFVLNVGGYVGDSTKSEVMHALDTGKPVRWLEASGWRPVD